MTSYRLTDAQRDLAANHLRLAGWLMHRSGCGPLDEDDAFQEACVGLLNSVSSYDPDSPRACKVAAYLGYGICSRLSTARKLRCYRPMITNSNVGSITDERPPRNDYDLDAALARLRLADRTLLRRYYLESVPFEVLRAEAGITQQSLSLRLQRARQRLRKVLEGDQS